MKHLDLFSGIGGFAYAADQVWDNVEHIFCDNDPFCQQVLKKHWPEAPIYGDIRQLITDAPDDRLEGKVSKRQACTNGRRTEQLGCDILTGGFPCQPFSAAGVRRGTSDDRYLWPEMLKVIQLTKPTWVIAENVGGILTWEEGMVFEQVCADLESAGYEVQPLVIPAAAVGAPHRRDRVWFIAYDHRSGLEKAGAEQSTARRGRGGSNDANDKNTGSQRSRGGHDANQRGGGRQIQDARPGWSRNWAKVATELCGVDDGLPVELGGFELSKSKHRAEQLKAYGNAIVPQVAIEIMKGIKLAS